ncbi:hypothetical protein ACQKP7_07315 [Pseudomonas frederiksbergensis]|uniref:hypothetical protein n=1 Tax=Pseudomonas frederiksbergensis TaxID=104087 RepID=UPI003D08F902
MPDFKNKIAGTLTLFYAAENQTFSIMEPTSIKPEFLTVRTYIPNATNGILSAIMPAISWRQLMAP